MADQTLGHAVLRTELDLTGLNRGLQDAQVGAERALGQVERRAQQSGSRIGNALSQGFQVIGQLNLSGLLGSGGLVAGLVSLEREAFEAQTGMRLLERQFERNSISFSEGRDALNSLATELRAMPEDLADNVAQLLRTGLSMEEISNAFRGGAASALAFGKTTSAGIEAVTGAIITGRSQLLDTVGISQNLDMAYRNYAATLGVTVDRLNDTQRAQAAVQLITRYTREEVEDMPVLLSGFGGAVNDLTREWKELRIALGDELMPTVTNVIQGLTRLVEMIGNMPPEVRRFTVGALAAVAALRTLVTVVTALRAALFLLSGPAGIIMAVTAAVGGLAYSLIRGRESLEGAFERAQTSAERAFDRISTANTLPEIRETAVALREELGSPQMAAAWDALIAKIDEGTASAEELKTALVDAAVAGIVAPLEAQLASLRAELERTSQEAGTLSHLLDVTSDSSALQQELDSLMEMYEPLLNAGQDIPWEAFSRIQFLQNALQDSSQIERDRARDTERLNSLLEDRTRLLEEVADVEGRIAAIHQTVVEGPGTSFGGGTSEPPPEIPAAVDDAKKVVQTIDGLLQEMGQRGAAFNRQAAAFIEAGFNPVDAALNMLRQKAALAYDIVKTLTDPVEFGGFGLPSDAPEVQFLLAKAVVWEEGIENLEELKRRWAEAQEPPEPRSVGVPQVTVTYNTLAGSIESLTQRAEALQQAIRIEPDFEIAAALAIELEQVEREIERLQDALTPRRLEIEPTAFVAMLPDPEQVATVRSLFRDADRFFSRGVRGVHDFLGKLSDWNALRSVVDDTRRELELVDTISEVFGETVEGLTRKQTLLRRAIETLIEMGLSKEHGWVKALREEYEALGGEIDAQTPRRLAIDPSVTYNLPQGSAAALRQQIADLRELRDLTADADEQVRLSLDIQALERDLERIEGRYRARPLEIEATVTVSEFDYEAEVRKVQRRLREALDAGDSAQATQLEQDLQGLHLYQALQELDRGGVENLSKFSRGVLIANGLLVDTSDLLEAVTEAQTDFSDAVERGTALLGRAPTQLDEVIERLQALIDGNLLRPENLEQAQGLLEELLDLRSANRTERELEKIAERVSVVVGAIETLAGIDWEDGNSVLEGMSSAAGDLVGMIPGMEAVGGLISTIGSALSTVLGDLRNGLAEVKRETEDIQDGFDLIDIDSLIRTKQVSRGGLLGLFGMTYTAIDEDASALGLSIARSLEDGVLAGLRNGMDRFLESGKIEDLEYGLQEGIYSGVTDALMTAIVEQGVIQTILGPALLELTQAIAQGYETGNYSYAMSILREIQALVPEIAQSLAPIFSMVSQLRPHDPNAPAESEDPRSGGRQIGEITGPTRDLFTDLLTPLAGLVSVPNLLQAQLRVQEQMLVALGGGAVVGRPALPAPGQPISGGRGYTPVPMDDPKGPPVIIEHLEIESSARNVRELYRDISEWHARTTRGRRR